MIMHFGFVATLCSDEIGFLHPSQFASLDEDSSSSSPTLATSVQLADGNIETSITESNTVQYDKTTFWNRDHKLAISTHVLCHLCVAARRAYMDVSRRYKASINLSLNSGAFCSVTAGANLDHLLENEILKHTKALLILSLNFASAWNCRSVVILCLPWCQLVDQILIDIIHKLECLVK